MTFPTALLAGPTLLLSWLALGASVAAQSSVPALTKETFKENISRETSLDYLLALPSGYEAAADKKWPLVVFLHGAGERGGDLEVLKKHGPPKLVQEGRKFPFILAAPQCPTDQWWPDEPVLELIDHLQASLHVDPNRIILTGLSMGGYGTWAFAARAPERFAAIVPICGGGTPYLMRRLTKLPIWVFHGGKDPVVALEESDRLVNALKKNGAQNVQFTIYPEAGHDSWTQAYATDSLYEWMMAQKRQP